MKKEEGIYKMKLSTSSTRRQMRNLLMWSHVLGALAATSLHSSVIHIPDDYPTIQMGVDSASPYDTISIAADSFHECIEIYKPLTVIGAGMDSTVITPPDTQMTDTTGRPCAFDWNIYVKANSVDIREISQYGSPDLFDASPSKIGIRVDSSTEISISYCRISGNRGVPGPVKTKLRGDSCGGIFVSNSFQFSIAESEVTDNATLGIKGYNTDSVYVQQNDISRNRGLYYENYCPGRSGYGIILDDCVTCVIKNNNISKNDGGSGINGCGGWGHGILLKNCMHNLLADNDIHCITGGRGSDFGGQGRGGWSYGIKGDSCDHVSVISNRISRIEGGSSERDEGGSATGVLLRNGACSQVRHNVVVDINGGNGTQCIDGNGYGICLLGGPSTIENNTVSGVRGGWAESPDWVNGTGTGILCTSNSCSIQRNAIVDNLIGASVSGPGVSIEECNFYFNTYQRYPTTPFENYELRADSVISVKNNFWWYADSARIDSLIDGPAEFMPFVSVPIESAPGEPKAVMSVRIFSDTGYSLPFTSFAEYGDSLYIELRGTDWGGGHIDPAIVIVTSSNAPRGIGVALIETDTATGVYRGRATILNPTNDVWDMIGANYNDTIVVCANVDSSKCDTVIMEGAGVEENRGARSEKQEAGLTVSPNPFVYNTVIGCRLAVSHDVETRHVMSLQIYDLSGRLVCSLSPRVSPSPRLRVAEWDGKDNNGRVLPAGIYFCTLGTGESNRMYSPLKLTKLR